MPKPTPITSSPWRDRENRRRSKERARNASLEMIELCAAAPPLEDDGVMRRRLPRPSFTLARFVSSIRSIALRLRDLGVSDRQGREGGRNA